MFILVYIMVLLPHIVFSNPLELVHLGGQGRLLLSLTIVLYYNSEKGSLLSQAYENPGDRTIVKAKRKGIPGDCQIRQTLEIPLFLVFLELFYWFLDRRHTVSTWVETMP